MGHSKIKTKYIGWTLTAMLAAAIFVGSVAAGKLPSAGSGSISLAVPEPVGLGDLVHYNVAGTDGLNNPRVLTSCFQDGLLVYAEGIGAFDTFKLGGGSSDWLNEGGGPANCHAALYYIPKSSGKAEWNGHGGQGEFVTLASTSFDAEG